jgi:hypothetical protein
MPREIQTQVSPEVAHNESLLNDMLQVISRFCERNSKSCGFKTFH